jgi:type II secretory pathway component PulC
MLGLLCALLVTILAIELVSDPGSTNIEPVNIDRSNDDTEEHVVENDFPPIAQYSEFVERPLFESTRRPLELDGEKTLGTQNTVANTPGANDIELSGISISQARKLAVIKRKANNEYYHVEEGQSFAGWTLDEIRPDLVVLSDARSKVEIPLLREGPKGIAARKKRELRRTAIAEKKRSLGAPGRSSVNSKQDKEDIGSDKQREK